MSPRPMTFEEASKYSTHLFTLKLNVSDGHILVHAFEGRMQGPNHTRIDVEVVHALKTKLQTSPEQWAEERCVIFARGDTYCGIPSHLSIDGADARELVLSLIAMKPGDVDEDYFTGYTDAQLAFAEKYGDEIAMEAQATYCDEDGRVLDNFDTENDPLEVRE